MRRRLDLSIVIPALDEADNLAVLLPQLVEVVDSLGISFEIVIVTRRADARTLALAQPPVRVIEQEERGYGGALIAGFERSEGAYLLTMDADLSHRPSFIVDLWRRRRDADITIASRYVPGGKADMTLSRYLLSRGLNGFFSRGLSLSVRDMSSGFRLYKSNVVRGQSLVARDFDVLQEILVRAYAEGRHAQEVPFGYAAREHGRSHARVFRFGLAYLKTFFSLWRLRNSIASADYDDRAYDSAVPLQRYWQRQRYRHVTELIAGHGRVLNVGCGSSRILGALPAGSVGIDVLLRKLRYAKKFSRSLVHGSGFALPFGSGSFPCVLCSQVIEHVPKESPILAELDRVLVPGGVLVLGTPDYARWEWVWMEKAYGLAAPGGYADEHISHYTQRELADLFAARGFTLLATRYILRGELIMAFRKEARGTGDAATGSVQVA